MELTSNEYLEIHHTLKLACLLRAGGYAGYVKNVSN